MQLFFEAAGADYHNEKVLVTLSKTVKDFPSLYIATGGKDLPRGDGRVLETMSKKEVVNKMSDHYEGVSRHFCLFPDVERGHVLAECR